MSKKTPDFVSTTNACKLCRPLGAVLAFRGVAGAVPYLHGSQGCATYMRRYIISHFNEPIDIASSSLGEKNAIYGGGANLKMGLKNVTAKYRPELIGIATTCLTETIGDDLHQLLGEYRREFLAGDQSDPLLVRVSTPSYAGSHMEGFHGAVRALVEQLVDADAAEAGLATDKEQAGPVINLLPGLVSPADLRLLKEIMAEFQLSATILPDISETLDGPALDDYPLIPQGGTEICAIRRMGRAEASIEFGRTLPEPLSAAGWLASKHGVECHRLGLPLGLRETDRFLALLADLTNTGPLAAGARLRDSQLRDSRSSLPPFQAAARGRLLDAMVDGHKYLAGKQAVVYGEEDLVVGLVSLLAECGVRTVLCASGGKSGKLAAAVKEVAADLLPELPEVEEDCDFFDIAARARQLKPDLLIGHSKGYSLARELGIPLIRVGFPIHDRLGGQRILHLGYQGAQQLFDTIVNTVIARKQDDSPVGYSYM
ncbi:nitrogenase component 1 [Desulfurivibrio dismutans]|uniref:nitrogenase component 1 n=1 Tax=Desulfurivibrio dismutans TaxID=1398908 RepID=UPI0023DAEA28|nr:nitrogenase component 1 [Desulfurivibrio alkaliphilus]MDF1614098.1 nitrogenase component 1 [Desulfurivibrio alkaliphilus]